MGGGGRGTYLSNTSIWKQLEKKNIRVRYIVFSKCQEGNGEDFKMQTDDTHVDTGTVAIHLQLTWMKSVSEKRWRLFDGEVCQ